jgi:hypothetical protein
LLSNKSINVFIPYSGNDVIGDGSSVLNIGTDYESGYNSFRVSGVHLSISYLGTIYAKYNYWKENPPTQSNVDYIHALSYDPNSSVNPGNYPKITIRNPKG